MDCLVTRNVQDLSLHPCFVRHLIPPAMDKLSALAARGEDAFREPLTITQRGLVLDGYARLHLAKTQRRPMLNCLELQMSDDEALVYVIRRSRQSSGLNDYLRLLLAFELEEDLKTQACSNQRIGGRAKGSSNLAEASRLDVRRQIAKLAGLAEGNVTTVKHLLSRADPELIDALTTT